jgi:TIR domain
LNAIDWNAMSEVNSTALFQETKGFLLSQKEAGRLLSPVDDLYYSFLETQTASIESDKLYSQFETCVKLLDSRGLVRRLSFGNLILLQPELIDAYASAIVNAAKDEPEGLGSISEADARSGNFQMSEDERIENKSQEKLLLIATVEDLLRHEIALRDQDDLVFPSQFTREYPDASNPEGKSSIFTFEGAIHNIYSKLIVRLSRSTIFTATEMWKNAALFSADVGGGICGVLLNQLEDGKAEMTLFFNSTACEETRFRFENYIGDYLQRQGLKGSVIRRRLFVCPDCQEVLPDRQVQLRRQRKFVSIKCPICESEVSILDGEERLSLISASNGIADNQESVRQSELDNASAASEIDQSADMRRKQETANAVLQGKIETNDFDVFLAHNSQDKSQVEAIANVLRQRGLNPWIDKEQITPGQWVQDAIQDTIVSQVKSAAIFIGSSGIGRWQALELRSFIQQCVEGKLTVIPVLLPGVDSIPDNLPFLQGLSWVSFEESINELDPLGRLEWGITGRNPQRASKNLDRSRLVNKSQKLVENSQIEIFISYSHKDDKLREELNIHLANLKRQRKIVAWHDREIEAGEEWDVKIKSNLESARIILLLISPDFMASDYCYDLEMRRAIQRHQNGTARVIPIILRPTDWTETPFSKLQVLPKDKDPITRWADRDAAFVHVVQEIRQAVELLQEENKK